jgi:hypothetical protein
MNRNYLGDAHDWMKGAIFRRLLDAGVMNDFAADPMPTDVAPWSPIEYHLYASLLQVKPKQIVHHSYALRDKRQAYFQELKHPGDIFLDPDIGIRTGNSRPLCKYVRPSEIIELASRGPERLVVVYQHIRGQTRSDRLAVVQSAFSSPGSCVEAAVYGSASVALVFAARSRYRVRKVYDVLREFLGPYSERRVTLWECHGA